MPAFAPMTLTDHASAAKTFVPKDITNGVVTWVHNASGVPIADEKVTLSQTVTSTGRQKVLVKFAFPIVQDMVVNGVSKPTAVRTAYADITFTFDSTSAQVERSDMLSYIWSFVSGAVASETVEGLHAVY